MSSLKEQLLKAGLVKKKEVQKTPKKKAPTQAKKNRKKVSEQTLRTQRAMLNKAKKDKKLNLQRQAETERKALKAQIKQWVDTAKLDRKGGETAYNFTYRKKVRTVYVTGEQQKHLAQNLIVIICLEGEIFELVPKKVAQKIAEKDPKCVIENTVHEAKQSLDDPYVDFQVPDDLVW